ncbi:uncharacterized protein BYT42DRAFT_487140 [Radiomyces spectabilis]|uniref:uncharacterized protein n=1 Tax=Radiomyces spectabilis TaxID=64574 RepID=UPI00221F1C46|nr:uncharacterized protein BYT42DRAFT_487140 [Radiomyces spectabilis]KAI8394258.1 hypothetical protein BYT42DRAFT_487140 [Radiomyces spectabilis]
MSRHRNVRNLDIDEVLDEDEFVDDYDENELDETQLSNEDLDNLEEGLSYIYSVVGENVPVSATEIKEALWYYYFDREETVNWVLEKIAKYEAEEKKQKAKQAKKNAAQGNYGFSLFESMLSRCPKPVNRISFAILLVFSFLIEMSRSASSPYCLNLLCFTFVHTLVMAISREKCNGARYKR